MQAQGVRISRLELEEFRLYRRLELEPASQGMRVVGPNGSGKTTIIEALLLISTTRSRRGVLDSDLINHASGEKLGTAPYARVRAQVLSGERRARVEIFIERTRNGNTTRKLLRVGDVPKRAVDVIGAFPTVSFSPEDLDLIVGSPNVRRRFLDVVLSQVDREYMRHLSRYGRMITHRNSLLRSIAEGAGSRDELAFWDDQIVALGAYIVAARAIAVAAIGAHAARRFEELSGSSGDLSVTYAPRMDQSAKWWESLLGADLDVRSAAQRVAVALERAVSAALAEDLSRGATTVGPHRDELEFQLGGRPIQRFGSRGQQRLAIVALKLAEIDFMVEWMGLRPALLLDDVLSELDDAHRDALLRQARSSGCQLFVTATDLDLVRHPELDDLDLAMIHPPGELAVVETQADA